MRKSDWTPSIVTPTIVPEGNNQTIVPDGNDKTIYLVADDCGRPGCAWVETDYETTELETVIQDLLAGQYNNPLRIIAFNPGERWSGDVSQHVAREVRRRCDLQMRAVPYFLQDFTNRYRNVQRQIP